MRPLKGLVWGHSLAPWSGPGQGLWDLEGVGGGLVGSATQLPLETASHHRLKCVGDQAWLDLHDTCHSEKELWQAPCQSPVKHRLRRQRQGDCHFELGYTVLLIRPQPRELGLGLSGWSTHWACSHLSSQPGGGGRRSGDWS